MEISTKNIPKTGLALWITYWLLAVSVLAQTVQPPFPTGKIIDTVSCQQVPLQRYALYLPSAYHPSQTWPVLFLFDPTARGSLPLQHFRLAAEKYGYILVGSHNSRNGSWQVSFDAIEAISNDVKERLSMDPQRIYTSGFSGGSRAAAAVAALSGIIAGIIGCGAGLPNIVAYHPKPPTPIVYVGMVGNLDMNYREMLELDTYWRDRAVAHNLLIFNGGHEWPPAEKIVEAFDWLELQAMKKGLTEKKTAWLDSLYQQSLAKARQYETAGQPYEAWLTYQQLATDFDGLQEIATLHTDIARLGRSRAVQQIVQHKEQLRTQELTLQKNFADAYHSALASRMASGDDSLNESWWKTEAKHLNKLQKSDDLEEQWLGKRMQNSSWVMCAEQGRSFMEIKDYKAAEISFRVWTILEPDAPRAYYQLATAYALENKATQAVNSLEKAVEKGLTPTSAIESNPAFDLLRQENRYKKLMAKLKAGQP